jgi:hypothetical protein
MGDRRKTNAKLWNGTWENGLFDMISGQQGLNDEDTDVSDKVKFFWR